MADRLLSVERRILAAYREFFGENYVPSQQNTDLHVRVHKMCYFLSRIDCDIIDTGFVWNTFGPFSVLLQEILRQMDAKRLNLHEFYQNCKSDDILDADIIEGICRLKNGLQVSEHSANPRYWIELLASLAFIAHSELPISDFEHINKELQCRKPAYSSGTDNRIAWELLANMGFAH